MINSIECCSGVMKGCSGLGLWKVAVGLWKVVVGYGGCGRLWGLQ